MSDLDVDRPSCPAWCDSPPDHDWGSLLQGEDLMRSHEHVIEVVPVMSSGPRQRAVHVVVAQIEVVERDGRIERLPAAVTLLNVADLDELSTGNARQLAAALESAATFLDRAQVRVV